LFSSQEKSWTILALKVFERVHECLRKLGRVGQEAEVSAREIDNLAAPLPCQHPVGHQEP